MSEPYDGPDLKPEVQVDDKKPEEVLVVPQEGILEGDSANVSFARDILASVVDEVIRRSKVAPADNDSLDNTDKRQLPRSLDSAPKSDPASGQGPVPINPRGDSARLCSNRDSHVTDKQRNSESTLQNSEFSVSNISSLHSRADSELNALLPDIKGAPRCVGTRRIFLCPYAVPPPPAVTVPRAVRPSVARCDGSLPPVAPFASAAIERCCNRGAPAQYKPSNTVSDLDENVFAMRTSGSKGNSQLVRASSASIIMERSFAHSRSSEPTKDAIVTPRRSSLISILPLGPSSKATFDSPNFTLPIKITSCAVEVQTSPSLGWLPFSISRISKAMGSPSVGAMIHATEILSSFNFSLSNEGDANPQDFDNRKLTEKDSDVETPKNMATQPYEVASASGSITNGPGGSLADVSDVANHPSEIAASIRSVSKSMGNMFNNPYGVNTLPCCAADGAGNVVQQSCCGVPQINQFYGFSDSPCCDVGVGTSPCCDVGVGTSTCCDVKGPSTVNEPCGIGASPCCEIKALGNVNKPCKVACTSCDVQASGNVSQSCDGTSIPIVEGCAPDCDPGNPSCAAAPQDTAQCKCLPSPCALVNRGCLGNMAVFEASRAHAVATAAASCAAASVAVFGGCRKRHSSCPGPM